MKKIYLTMMAAALLVVGLTACGGSSSNLLNVEAPAWTEFVHPKADGVKLYKFADENSPKLQIAQEHCEGDMCDVELIWAGQKVKRGWTVNDWDTYVGDVFPVIAEEGDFYKVYASSEWIGAAEVYMKKSECEIVKPVKLTQEVLDSIGKTGYRRDFVVQEGALKNLCLSSYLGEYDGLEFGMGQLCDNCLVFVETKALWLSSSDENGPIKFVRAENDEDGNRLEFGKDNFWMNGEESMGLFDTKKLSEEQVKDIFNAIREDSARITQVLYYFPDIDKERMQYITIFENVKSGGSPNDISNKMLGYIPSKLAAYYEKQHPIYKSMDKAAYMQAEEDIQKELMAHCDEVIGHQIPIKGSPYNIKFTYAVIDDAKPRWSIVRFNLKVHLSDGDNGKGNEWINCIYALFKTTKGDILYVDYLRSTGPNYYELSFPIKGDPYNGINPAPWDDLEYIEMVNQEEGRPLFNKWLDGVAEANRNERTRR